MKKLLKILFSIKDKVQSKYSGGIWKHAERC